MRIGEAFVGIVVLLLCFRSGSECTDFSLSKVFKKNISTVCDSIIGELKEDICAGLGLDISTSEIFWEKDSNTPHLVASLTKLMVTLIVMEKIETGELKFSDIITVTSEATEMIGAQLYFQVGDQFYLDELLKAIMIYSANDATYLVAQYIGGTEENFVSMMNAKARSMGLRETYFSNSPGLPPLRNKSWAHNVSSCIDMAYIALKVIEYPEVMEWASTAVDYIRNGELVLRSWNKLLRECAFVDGLKTGYYKRAGYNIVATSTQGNKKIMAIVLGAKSAKIRNKVARILIEYGLYNP